MEEWSVGAVAELAGVTTRTLRHYDQIGLLVADRDPVNSYRVYRREHLLRLQQIVLLRDLDLSLSTIADLLVELVDDTTVLRRHRNTLLQERDRLDRVIHTITATIDERSGGPHVEAAALFDGFERNRQRFRQRLIDRIGIGVDEHFAAADTNAAAWTDTERAATVADGRHIMASLDRLRQVGVAPDSPRVAPFVAAHREALRQSWNPDDHAYRTLADLVVDDPLQREIADQTHPDLAPWLRAAILAHTPI